MKNWYSIECRAEDGRIVADISIMEHIGMFGVTASMFAAELVALGDVDEIRLELHTPGGSIFEGLTIYSALRDNPADVTVTVGGLAASMGSVIMLAGDTRRVRPVSTVMVHNPSNFGAGGESKDLRKAADTLDKLKNTIVDVYVNRTGIDREKIEAMMEETTFMNAEEALENGFATEILADGSEKSAALFEPSDFTNSLGLEGWTNDQTGGVPQSNKGDDALSNKDKTMTKEELIEALAEANAANNTALVEAIAAAIAPPQGDPASVDPAPAAPDPEPQSFTAEQVQEMVDDAVNAAIAALEGAPEPSGEPVASGDGDSGDGEPEPIPSYQDLYKAEVRDKHNIRDHRGNVKRAKDFMAEHGSEADYNAKHNL